MLQQQIQQKQRLVVDDYYSALRTSQNYYIAMLDAETGVRGYALSGGDTAVTKGSERWMHIRLRQHSSPVVIIFSQDGGLLWVQKRRQLRRGR